MQSFGIDSRSINGGEITGQLASLGGKVSYLGSVVVVVVVSFSFDNINVALCGVGLDCG